MKFCLSIPANSYQNISILFNSVHFVQFCLILFSSVQRSNHLDLTVLGNRSFFGQNLNCHFSKLLSLFNCFVSNFHGAMFVCCHLSTQSDCASQSSAQSRPKGGMGESTRKEAFQLSMSTEFSFLSHRLAISQMLH